MKELSLIEYLKNPCGSASIPYWKQKSTVVPDNIAIVHNDYYNPNDFKGYTDERYFRLYHDLKIIGATEKNDIEILNVPDSVDCFVKIINESYADLSVTKEQIESYCKTSVYNPDLWIVIKNKITGEYIGSGIADYDREIGELILEWIQVLPSQRGRGYGQIIVNNLLGKMRDTAKFATVSGKISNPTNPEKLYRKCGFTGNDVWHILCKE